MCYSHWYVCMVRCADGSLYTDVVETDPEAGVRRLNDGDGAPYVRARLPVFLAYTEEYMNERDARVRADAIRRLSRVNKEALLAVPSLRAISDSLSPKLAAA